MTDFATPTTISRRRIHVPGLADLLPSVLRGMVVPLVLCGRAFATILTAYGQAMQLALSAPFSRPSQRQRFASEEDLEGRDPNW